MLRKLVCGLFAAFAIALVAVASAAAHVQHVTANGTFIEAHQSMGLQSFGPAPPCLTNFGFGGEMISTYSGFYDITIDSHKHEVRVRGKIRVDITWAPYLGATVDQRGPVTDTGHTDFRFQGLLQSFAAGTIEATAVTEMTRSTTPSTTQYTPSAPTARLRLRHVLEFINDPEDMGIGLSDASPVNASDACL
jgi:hypothetical protein